MKLHITEPMLSKTPRELEKHEKEVFNEYDRLDRARQTIHKREENPDYFKKGIKSAPKYIWKDREPEKRITNLRIGKTNFKGTPITGTEYFYDNDGKRQDGKLFTIWIRW